MGATKHTNYVSEEEKEAGKIPKEDLTDYSNWVRNIILHTQEAQQTTRRRNTEETHVGTNYSNLKHSLKNSSMHI